MKGSFVTLLASLTLGLAGCSGAELNDEAVFVQSCLASDNTANEDFCQCYHNQMATIADPVVLDSIVEAIRAGAPSPQDAIATLPAEQQMQTLSVTLSLISACPAE